MEHPPSTPHWLPFPQFQEALAAANLRLSRIRDRYPHLKAYAVLSSLAGQTKIDNGLPEMIDEFPGLFLDSPAKVDAYHLIRELRSLEKQRNEAKISQRSELNERIRALPESIRELSRGLAVDGNCRIELRFHRLDYDLISKLQTDEWVDPDLTPRTGASIRIVLGTIFRLHQSAPHSP